MHVYTGALETKNKQLLLLLLLPAAGWLRGSRLGWRQRRRPRAQPLSRRRAVFPVKSLGGWPRHHRYAARPRVPHTAAIRAVETLLLLLLCRRCRRRSSLQVGRAAAVAAAVGNASAAAADTATHPLEISLSSAACAAVPR